MRTSYCKTHDTYPDDNEPCWQCVNKYATDAEALAMALEKVDAAFKSYEIMFPAQYAYLVNIEIPNVLRQYRARFPKAQENKR